MLALSYMFNESEAKGARSSFRCNNIVDCFILALLKNHVIGIESGAFEVAARLSAPGIVPVPFAAPAEKSFGRIFLEAVGAVSLELIEEFTLPD